MTNFKKSHVILAALLFTQYVAANDKCKISIEANDAMAFSTKSFEVSKSCTSFEITLTHVGKMTKQVMGHNLVITSTADFSSVAIKGMSAGIDNNYVTPNDERVIANTIVIGGGESTSIKFPTGKFEKGTDYTFFCSFPGHYAIMKGKISVI